MDEENRRGAPDRERIRAGTADPRGRRLQVVEPVPKKPKRRRILLTVLLVVAMILVLLFIIVWKVFTLETVKITGSRLYSDETIKESLLDEDLSWNTLYVYARYTLSKPDDMPYIASLETVMTPPHKIEFIIVEKEAIGCLYDPGLSQYVYFDADGYVVQASRSVMEGYIQILGLNPEDVELYHTMTVDSSSILMTIQSAMKLLKKYEILPERILVQEGNKLLMDYGEIQVTLGTGSSLNEKVVRVREILPRLEGKSGTLHAETWTEDATDIYFRIGELEELPEY